MGRFVVGQRVEPRLHLCGEGCIGGSGARVGADVRLESSEVGEAVDDASSLGGKGNANAGCGVTVPPSQCEADGLCAVPSHGSGTHFPLADRGGKGPLATPRGPYPASISWKAGSHRWAPFLHIWFAI